ncbi:MAG: translocation/assembly module TamB domain-containing protein [Rhodospirillales bacterium]|nr:translocation/assembly module TamB domain-containing protein [Rhodospirillales bacterium]
MLRRALLAVGGVIAVLVVVLGGGLLFLQTAAGGRIAAQALTRLVSVPGEAELNIATLEPGLPAHLALRGIVLRDASGEWLAVDRIVVDWRPLALLRGSISVREAVADGVRLSRLPEAGANAEGASESRGLPTLPLALQVDGFRIDNVEIGPAVAGEKVALRAGGRLAAERAGRIETTVSVIRTDGVGGEANLAATWLPATRALSLDARLDEPKGGLLGTAIGLAGQPPVRLSVSGGGPIGAWRGLVNGAIGEDVRLDADVRSETDASGVIARTTGRAEIAAMLDDAWRPLTEGGVTFALALRRPDGDGLRIEALEAAAAGARLTGNGIVDPEAGRIETANLRLAVADGSVLGPLLGPASLRSLDAQADLSGSWAAPTIVASGAVNGVRLPDASVDRADWTARYDPAQSAGGRDALHATITLADARAGGMDLAALLGGGPRLDIDATLDRDGKKLAVDAVKFEAPALALEGEGSIDLAGGDGEGALRGRADSLAAFATVTGLPLEGRADFTANASRHDGRIEAVFSIATDALKTSLAPLDVLLGARPTLNGRFAADPAGRSLRLDDVALEGEGIRAEASAAVADDALSGTYRVRIADIAPSAAAAGLAAQGGLRLDGDLSGAPADPRTQATLSLDDGRVAGVTVSPARAELTAEGLLSSPRGTLRIAAGVEGDPLNVNAPFARAADGGFHLGPFSASAPGVVASGTLDLPPAAGPIVGEVTLRTGTGGQAAAFAGYRLAGETDATIKLGGDGGEQSVDVALNGRSPALTTSDGLAGGAKTASLHAHLAGPPDRMRGEIEVSADALSVGGASLDALQATFAGSVAGGKVRMVARVPGAGGGEVRAAATVSRNERSTRIVVDSVDGELGGEAVALRRSSIVTVDDAGVRVEDLDLAVGDGGVSLSGRTGGKGTEGDLIVRDLPLALAKAVRPDLDLGGSLDARGSVRTRGAGLVGDLDIDLKAVRIGAMAPARAVDGTASVHLGDGVVAMEARSEIAGRPLQVATRLAANVDARTLALQHSPQAPLSGRLTWAGPIGELWELLPLPDQRLTGETDVDLRLGGTVADPRIDGAVTLKDGRYENFVTASVIEDLAVTAQADGAGGIALALHGTDGEHGTVTGNGSLAFAGGGRPLVDLTVTFTEATLVRRDDVTATLSGFITVRENAGRTTISGTITSDKMEVRLVDRLPPSVVVLDVKEINLPPGPPRPQKVEPAAPAFVAGLDIAVTMPQRVFVRGRGLESEWQGHLRVTGTTANPVLIGVVAVRTGVFDFAGRRFTIEKGDIGFTGGKRIDPTLNVVATRQASDLTARITVTGTASAPHIELSSQPALPDSEILARILFGKDVSKLGPVELAQLGLALDTLASGESLSEDALSYLRNLLGLDVLTVETGDENGGGPSVGVGRYVAEGVYVGARQGVEDDSTAGTVEVEILPGLSVESEVSDTANGPTGALGLRWRWDY